MVMEGHRKSFPIIIGGVGLQDYIVSPVPVFLLWTLDFEFGTGFGTRFGTWIWDWTWA